MWSRHDRSDRWMTQISGTCCRIMCQYRGMVWNNRITAMIKLNWGRSGNDVLHVDGAGHYGCKMGSESLKHLVPMIFVFWDCGEEWTDEEFFVVKFLWSNIMADGFGRRWIHDYALQRQVRRMRSWCCQFTSQFLFSVKYGTEIHCFNKAGMTDEWLGAPPWGGGLWLNVGTMLLLRCIVEARLLNKYLTLELSNFIII